jgi:hypothetical protein
MCTSDVVKSYLGLLCLSMNDYDAILTLRQALPAPAAPAKGTEHGDATTAVSTAKRTWRFWNSSGWPLPACQL